MCFKNRLSRRGLSLHSTLLAKSAFLKPEAKPSIKFLFVKLMIKTDKLIRFYVQIRLKNTLQIFKNLATLIFKFPVEMFLFFLLIPELLNPPR